MLNRFGIWFWITCLVGDFVICVLEIVFLSSFVALLIAAPVGFFWGAFVAKLWITYVIPYRERKALSSMPAEDHPGWGKRSDWKDWT